MQKLLNLTVKMWEDYYDCYDVMIMTLCDYFGVDRNRAFCWRWGFNYVEQTEGRMVSLYDNMYVNRNQDTVCKFMEKYLGLELHGYQYDDIGDFGKFVQKKIESGIPVGIVTDTSKCYWNPLYQKQSIRHCSLIVGYDEENYFLKEPYFSEETYHISKDCFDRNLVWSVLDLFHQKLEQFDLLTMLKEGFEYVNCNDMKYESMLRYSRDLCALIEIDLQNELIRDDIRYIPSLRSIKNLGSERKGLLALFREYSECVTEEIISLLSECIEKWQICLTRLMQVYLTRKTDRLASVSVLFSEIADIEKQIYEEMMSYIASNHCEE